MYQLTHKIHTHFWSFGVVSLSVSLLCIWSFLTTKQGRFGTVGILLANWWNFCRLCIGVKLCERHNDLDGSKYLQFETIFFIIFYFFIFYLVFIFLMKFTKGKNDFVPNSRKFHSGFLQFVFVSIIERVLFTSESRW